MKIASIIIAALALSLMGIGLVKISHLRFKNQPIFPALAAGSSFIDLKTLGINLANAKTVVDAAKLILGADKKALTSAEEKLYATSAKDLPKKQSRKNYEFNVQLIDKALPTQTAVLEYKLDTQQFQELVKEIKACPKGFAVLKVNPTSSVQFTKDTFEFGYQLIVVNCKTPAAIQFYSLTAVRTGKVTPIIEKKMVEECTSDRFGFKKCVNVEKQIETPRQLDDALKTLITKVMTNKVVQVCEDLMK